MADQVSQEGGAEWNLLPPVIVHEEVFCSSDGRQWLVRIEVQWCPEYHGQVALFKLPDTTPISLPSYLPYREVVMPDIREAALDGCFDLEAITRFYVGRCVETLRQYVERFGQEL